MMGAGSIFTPRLMNDVMQIPDTAAIERSKDAAIHAIMLDPLTAAMRSPAEIKKMTLELFAVEKAFLPKYN